jgi:hypothetical protein
MGADLYRTGHDAIHDAIKPQWDALIQERNTLIDIWEHIAKPHELAAVNAVPWIAERPYPEHIRDIISQVDAMWDAMYPPSHYFRDSYNDWSLLAQIDLSWWRDVGALLDAYPPDANGYASPDVAAGLLALVATPENMATLRGIPDADTRMYFLEKYDRLCHLLQSTIESGDSILYSI